MEKEMRLQMRLKKTLFTMVSAVAAASMVLPTVYADANRHAGAHKAPSAKSSTQSRSKDHSNQLQVPVDRDRAQRQPVVTMTGSELAAEIKARQGRGKKSSLSPQIQAHVDKMAQGEDLKVTDKMLKEMNVSSVTYTDEQLAQRHQAVNALNTRSKARL